MYPNSPEKESPKIGIELLKEGKGNKQMGKEKKFNTVIFVYKIHTTLVVPNLLLTHLINEKWRRFQTNLLHKLNYSIQWWKSWQYTSTEIWSIRKSCYTDLWENLWGSNTDWRVSTDEVSTLHTKSWRQKGAYLCRRMLTELRDYNRQNHHCFCSCLFWLRNPDCGCKQRYCCLNIERNRPFSRTSFAAFLFQTQAPIHKKIQWICYQSWMSCLIVSLDYVFTFLDLLKKCLVGNLNYIFGN